VDKISAATLLEGFCEVVGQSPLSIRLQIDHSAQVTELPPSHALNTNITLVELLHVLKTLQEEQGYWFGWYES
jgi:hypothetical protein